MKEKQRIFQFITLTTCLWLILPDLLQHGMFMDGTQYACVARNLAMNRGSFWFPYLSSSWQKMGVNSFLEHLPLTYYLQSKFFYVIGFSVFTEKSYCLLMAVICAWLIFKTWKLLFNNHPVLSHYWWFAILLWFITPSVYWSYSNNMLENTVSVMVLASAYFSIATIKKDFGILFMLIASVFVFLAVCCKGLPGFFSISIVFCYYLVTGQISLRKMFLYTSCLVLIPLVIFSCIFLFNTEARLSLSFYFENRLLHRLASDPTVENRFTILFWLFTDLLVDLILVVILLFASRKIKIKFPNTPQDRKLAFFFLLYGICGVLPLCFTHVQRATYFVPALPFFSIAFAVLISPGLNNLIHRLNSTGIGVFKIIVFTGFSGLLIYCCIIFGGTSRDRTILDDVRKIGNHIGNNKLIGTSNDIYLKWDFQFYLLRYYNDELKTTYDFSETYLLLRKNSSLPDNKSYTKEGLELSDYLLFKRVRASSY